MLTQEKLITILGEIETAENQQRKRDEYASYQIYEGALRYFVKKDMQRIYPKTSDMFHISDYSILKKIVDKKAKAYKESPVRKLENDIETELYHNIVKTYSLNEAMKSVDKLFNQHKYCLLACFFERVDFYGELKEQFKFIPLAPYEFDVVLGEMGELLAVILSYPDEQVVTGQTTDGINTLIAGNVADKGRDKKLYAIWTEKNHWIVEGIKTSTGAWKFGYVVNEKNPTNLNPYQVLPFVYLPIDFSADYPIASPLASQTVQLNSELSTYYTSGSLQIGTLVLKYPSEQPIEVVTQGLFTGMKLPQSGNPDAPQTDANYIAPSPNMSGHKEAILTHVSAIMDEQGINSNQLINPNESFTSGFDRLLSSADVQDIIEDNQGFYKKVEEKIYFIVKNIYKNFIGKDIFKSKSISIVYKKPKVLVSETEKLANISSMESLGILLPWEKFMLIDPNLSEQEAKEKYEQIMAIRVEKVAMFQQSKEKEDAEKEDDTEKTDE